MKIPDVSWHLSKCGSELEKSRTLSFLAAKQILRVCTLQSLLLRGKLRVSSQQLFLGLDDLSEVHVVQLASVVVHKLGCLRLLFDVVPQPNVVIVVPFQRRLIVQLRFQLRFLLQQIYIISD